MTNIVQFSDAQMAKLAEWQDSVNVSTMRNQSTIIRNLEAFVRMVGSDTRVPEHIRLRARELTGE